MLGPADFFDLDGFAHAELFAGVEYVWQALDRLPDYLARFGGSQLAGNIEQGAVLSGPVWIGEGTVVESGVRIIGPAIIGRGCHIRSGAYLRGLVVVGDEAIVGHATELKVAILLDRAHAPHFNYVGDSILGPDSNLGAGTICSNVRLDRQSIIVHAGGRRINTGTWKLGAIVGQGVQTGCNSVLNPGTLLGRGVVVLPGASIAGYYPSGIAGSRPPERPA